MLRLESIEFGTREACQHCWISETTSRGYDVKQLSRDDVDFITAGECDIFKLRMHRDAEICRQSPGRGCPDQRENFSSGQRWIDRRGIALQRKLNVNGRTGALVIFDFRLSERRLIVNAPVNRARALVNEAACHKLGVQMRRIGV